MEKVYMIKYIECDYEGMTMFDDCAFKSYRAASSYLLGKEYEVEVERGLNNQDETHSYELVFKIEETNGISETTLLASINELIIK